MKVTKEIQHKIQELQITEHNLQTIIMQKQAFQLELNEIESALEEVKKTNDEVYKISGQIMIKSKKDEVEKELEEKMDIINLRIKSIEKQEQILVKKLEGLREEVEKEIKKNK